MNAHLAEILKKLPHTPGVYLMKNAEGEVIYVGKAKSLHNRVHSYFQNRDALTPKTRALVEHIADIETVCVNSPQEALILENNFIKQYKPKYNIMLRDDKRYPFLCLTESEEFPRLILVRSPKADGNSYFGPYVSGLQRKELEQLLRELFPLRLCNAKSWSKNHRPCLNYHIGKCHAPCAGNISTEDYAELVAQCKLFLNGKTEQVTTETEKAMKQAAAEQRFEEAAALRDRLFALQTLMQKQQLESGDVTENRDFIAIACRDDQCIAQVFLYRNGKVVGREHFKLQNPAEEEAAAVMARFLSEYYEGAKNLPKEICLNIEPEDKEGLEAWLSAQNGKKVQLSLPQRGDKKKLMQLVQHNAELVLTERLESKAYKEQKAALALEQLREVLQLEKTPYRMECYDISHFQGTHTVGSMVVFEGGMPAKQEYRRFRIKTVEGVDDFASLQEVLHRRYERGLKEQNDEKSHFAKLPDLLIIDGGKGQLSSVCEVLAEMGVSVNIISLAKQFEEIYIPEHSEPIVLPHSAPALQLLQQIRDEAHRFAITFHRELRGKSQVHSELLDIKGLGEKRRKLLLDVFGSVSAIKEASLDRLQAVQGLPKATAKAVYEYFHAENNDQ